MTEARPTKDENPQKELQEKIYSAPVAFYFELKFESFSHIDDQCFTEVSGLSVEMQMTEKEDKSGNVVKLTITSYNDEGFGSENGNFEVMSNPKDYGCTKGIRYNKEEIIDGGNIPIYQGCDNDNLKFEFTLDTTGALTKDPTVSTKWDNKTLRTVLKGLEDTVYSYVGDTHQPPFL